MNSVPAELYPRSDQDRHLGVPYEERWRRLKPIIIQLYLGNYSTGGKTTTLAQLAEFMKLNYSFYAVPKQYRTHFEAWDIKKNVGKEKKDGAVLTLTKRKRPGASTSHVTVTGGRQDKQLPPGKLMRHIKEQRRHAPIERLMPGLLSSWNLPYEAFIASIHQDTNRPSPFGPRASTPEGLKIESPKPTTPGHDTAGQSPNMELVYQKAKEDRATLFVQGRLDELIISMVAEDRKLFVNYFHDFYIDAFSKARAWGRNLWGQEASDTLGRSPLIGPRENLRIPSSLPNSQLDPLARQSSHRIHASEVPTQLCNWAIHLPSPSGDAGAEYSSEQSYEQPDDTPLPEQLRQTMLSSSFTSGSLQDLPFAQDAVVRAIEGDPEALELDSWKLAIMAGNTELIFKLYEDHGEEVPKGLDEIYPLHLAAAFLDGGHACCGVFEALSCILGPEYAFYENVDKLGHTILDALMTSVVRSHTAIKPEFVSKAFNPPRRFPGEEMDICGRWNPDTPSVRLLFHEGSPRIPEKWKHPFCHTAVQAICHSAITIFGPSCAPDINESSGLFIRRCTECGLELKLGPLHTLVVVTFCLAQYGMPGETLFGAVAMLMCLLSLGADVTLKANLCVEDILEASDASGCRHTDMSPLEMIKRVPDHVINNWTNDCRVGWNCFAGIISRAEQPGVQEGYMCTLSLKADPLLETEHAGLLGCDGADVIVHGSWLKLKCHNPDMGLLWATIQTEMLTYRRINEGDAWISEKFSLIALAAWLSGHSADFATPLVTNHMMKEHSKCGWFHYAEDFVLPTAQEVSEGYFMNMDDYSRSTYLNNSNIVGIWGNIEWELPSEAESDEE